MYKALFAILKVILIITILSTSIFAEYEIINEENINDILDDIIEECVRFGYGKEECGIFHSCMLKDCGTFACEERCAKKSIP